MLNRSEIIFLFMKEKRRELTAFVATMSGVFILCISFFSSPGTQEYRAVEQAYQRWVDSEDEDSYIVLRKALRKVPFLERKYLPVIAQRLFEKNRFEDAISFAEKSIQNVSDEVPFHMSFSETTLLIEKGDYQDALEKAVALREKISHGDHLREKVGEQYCGGTLLYVHNLLRIASLQKELKNRPGEKSAWEDLEAFLQMDPALSKVIFASFGDQKLDLSHYIMDRKKQLNAY